MFWDCLGLTFWDYVCAVRMRQVNSTCKGVLARAEKILKFYEVSKFFGYGGGVLITSSKVALPSRRHSPNFPIYLKNTLKEAISR